jgi:uncharacterized protein (TIGR03435 family)
MRAPDALCRRILPLLLPGDRRCGTRGYGLYPSGVDLSVLRRGQRSFWECANLFVALPFGLIAFTGTVTDGSSWSCPTPRATSSDKWWIAGRSQKGTCLNPRIVGNNMVGLALPFAFLLMSPQAPQLKLGDAAPDLKLRRLEGAKAGTELTLSSLKGKVVVVEFWATWCVPCVEALPHLSAVRKERPNVEFLAVTAEEPARVAAFLKTRSDAQVPVVMDAASQAVGTYGVKTIPHTVVIDKQGKIAAITWPDKLTAEALDAVAEGRDPKLPLKVDVAARFDELDPTAKVKVVIRRSNSTGTASRTESNRFVSDGAVPQVAYQKAYETSSFRSEFNLPKEESETPYYFDVVVPADKKEDLLPTLRSALQTAFGYKVSREMRQKKVYVLRRKQGSPLKMTKATSRGMSIFKHNGMIAKGTTMTSVAEFLESVLRDIVIDETNLEGMYDFEIQWIPENMESLLKGYEAVGLELVQETRDVEFVLLKGYEAVGLELVQETRDVEFVIVSK